MRPITFTTALLCALLLPTAMARASGGWTWPVQGQVLTEFHNGADPYAAGQHRGIDVAAAVGTPVVAATAGTIQYAGVVGSSGVTVSERTDDGRYTLSYLHLSALAVRRGQHVAAGAAVGAVGVSGRRSVTEPHLHFGVREAADRHAYLDPLRFLAPPPADKPAPRPVTVPAPVRVPTAAAPVAVPSPTAETVRALAPAVAGPIPAAGRSFGPSPAHALGGAAAPSAAMGTEHAAAGHPASTLGAAPHTAGAPAARAASGTDAARSAPAASRGFTAPHGGRRTAGPPRQVVAHGPVSPARDRAHAAVTTTAAAHARDEVRPAGGIDTGWLAACLGLVTAATLLARPGARGGRRGAGRAAFGTLLKAASRG